MSDLISREALIAKIKDDGILGNGYSDSERDDDVIDMIHHVPAVDADPVVHGEWLEVNHYGVLKQFECSLCGEHTDNTVIGKPRYTFCPMCGAKMDGGK